VIGLGTIVLGAFSAHVISLVVGAILVGLGLSFDVIENSVIQALVPDNLLSRVYSVNMVVSFALLPAGYAVAGFLARWIGTSWVLAGGGAVMIAACCCGALLPSLRRLNTGEAGLEHAAEAAS
jgi:MFS family permease